jgi:hypothetical protein
MPFSFCPNIVFVEFLALNGHPGFFLDSQNHFEGECDEKGLFVNAATARNNYFQL